MLDKSAACRALLLEKSRTLKDGEGHRQVITVRTRASLSHVTSRAEEPDEASKALL